MLTDTVPVSIPCLLEGRLPADNLSAVNCHPEILTAWIKHVMTIVQLSNCA